MGSSGPQCRTVCISTGLHCSWNTGSRCPVSARWADWAGRCPAAPEAFATAYPELESHSLHRLTPSKCTQASFCLRLRAGIWEAGGWAPAVESCSRGRGGGAAFKNTEETQPIHHRLNLPSFMSVSGLPGRSWWPWPLTVQAVQRGQHWGELRTGRIVMRSNLPEFVIGFVHSLEIIL